MLLYPLPVLLTPFPALVTSFPHIVFIIKGKTYNGGDLPSCPINEEAAVTITEAAGSRRCHHSLEKSIFLIFFVFLFCFCCCFFCFLTVSVAPSSINRSDFSSDSTILIISSISSFFSALTAPCPLIFLSNLSNRWSCFTC